MPGGDGEEYRTGADVGGTLDAPGGWLWGQQGCSRNGALPRRHAQKAAADKVTVNGGVTVGGSAGCQSEGLARGGGEVPSNNIPAGGALRSSGAQGLPAALPDDKVAAHGW